MKAQMKAVMASAVVIVLALAAVSGVTYSWWSDSEETQISVSSGYLEQETTGMKLNVVNNEYDLDSETGFKMVYGTSTGTTGYNSSDTTLTICGDPDDIQDVSVTYTVTFKSSVDYAYAILVEGDGLGYDISTIRVHDQSTDYKGGWVSESPIGTSLNVTYNVTIEITSIEQKMAGSPVIIKNVITQAANSGASTVSGTSDEVVNALTSGGDLLMVDDVTVNKTGSTTDPYITMSEKANISLGGNTLTIGEDALTLGATYEVGSFGLVIDGAEVTISGGTIKIADPTLEQGIRVKSGGSLTLNNVTIVSNVGLSTITLSESQQMSSLIMKGCSVVENLGSYVLTTNGNDWNNYDVSIEDCEFGNDIDAGSQTTAVFFAGNGDYKIEDSYIKGSSTGLEIRSGSLVADGSTFIGSKENRDKNTNGNGITIIGSGVAVSPHSGRNITVELNDCTVEGFHAFRQVNTTNDEESENVITTINGGKYTAPAIINDNTVCKAILNDYGTVILNSCKADGEAAVENRAVLEIHGGEFVGRFCYGCDETNPSHAVTNIGTLEIGGDVSVTGVHGALGISGGTAVINGGTYTVDECETHGSGYYSLYCSGDISPVDVTVKAGLFIQGDGRKAIYIHNIQDGGYYNTTVTFESAQYNGEYTVNEQKVTDNGTTTSTVNGLGNICEVDQT